MALEQLNATLEMCFAAVQWYLVYLSTSFSQVQQTFRALPRLEPLDIALWVADVPATILHPIIGQAVVGDVH
ncbi:hypothetical protein D3C76_1532960 [compost metagenome]